MDSFRQPGRFPSPAGGYYRHQANGGVGLDHINLLISTSLDSTVTTGWTALFTAPVIEVCSCVCERRMSPTHLHVDAASPIWMLIIFLIGFLDLVTYLRLHHCAPPPPVLLFCCLIVVCVCVYGYAYFLSSTVETGTLTTHWNPVTKRVKKRKY